VPHDLVICGLRYQQDYSFVGPDRPRKALILRLSPQYASSTHHRRRDCRQSRSWRIVETTSYEEALQA